MYDIRNIFQVNVATTHFAVMTSLGYVYTWGIGKSGQLARTDDEFKTLELIDTDDKFVAASDICCAGDATYLVERDSGTLYGCGFNSSGQVTLSGWKREKNWIFASFWGENSIFIHFWSETMEYF